MSAHGMMTYWRAGRGRRDLVLLLSGLGGGGSGIVLGVLQTADQPLVLLAKLSAHKGRLADHHYILYEYGL